MTVTHAQPGVRHVPIDTTRLYITEREQGYLLLLLAVWPMSKKTRAPWQPCTTSSCATAHKV